MTETKPGFLAQVKSFPSTFWVANTMEIFERMAWYGLFTVVALYMTGPIETGALGFSHTERGSIMAIVPFFLYIFPVVTGAIADRYGYRKMFIIAYSGMIVSYYLLGQVTTVPTFLAVFMLVAVAAAIFKPVVVGTVARVTNEGNSSIGFGVFYMMVNVGGFVGPFIAGVVRALSWDYVFIACACWAAVNLVIVLLFYKDPSTESGSKGARSFGKVMDDAVEVLGNARFFITVFVILISLMIPGLGLEWFAWFGWPQCWMFIGAWLVLNIIWDMIMPKGSGRPDFNGGEPRNPLWKRMHCSNWRFALFLLIMSGFWTSFNQIFLTMPNYIRDYVDTSPMVDLGRSTFSGIDWLSAVEDEEIFNRFDELSRKSRGLDPLVALSNEEFAEEGENVYKELEACGKDDELSAERHSRAAQLLKAIDKDALKSLKEKPDPTEGDGTGNTAGSRVDAGLSTAVRTGASFLHEIEQERLAKELLTDPSLSDDDRAELETLCTKLNAQGATVPLTPGDLVESARTMLQYQVRLQPSELATLLLAVPAVPQEIGDDLLAKAVETVNEGLEEKGKKTFGEGEQEPLKTTLKELMSAGAWPTAGDLSKACENISSPEREVVPKELAGGVHDIAYRPTSWERLDKGRQVNPEYIVNFDAGAIILLQVLISFLMAKFHRFTTMIVGMFIAAVGVGLSALAGGTMIGPIGGLLIVVIAGILIFAIGEMMASPTSQEYVGRIAPKEKVATYMGYYFVSMALGNLFGGLLSGELYQRLAVDAQRPDLMWFFFGGLMAATAVIFILYNLFVLPRKDSGSLTPS